MIVYNELERVGKEDLVTQFKMVSWNWPVGLRKNTRNLKYDGSCPDRDSNQTPPEYKSQPLQLHPTFSLQNFTSTT
jgi:hypothetical protein